MSFYDAYVGDGGTYSTVSAALADGKTCVCVLSDTTEPQSWLFGPGESRVDIVPSATVTYTSSDPLITTSANSIEEFYISVNGGTLITFSSYLTSTPYRTNSSVKFNYVTLTLRAVKTYCSSNILFMFDNTIIGNALFLSQNDNVSVSLTNNTVFGNISLSNGLNTNIDAQLTDNVIFGSVLIYSNQNDIIIDPLNKTSYPTVYKLSQNKIDVLTLTTLATTGIAYFTGIAIKDNTISSLNVTGPAKTNIAYSDIIGNTIKEINMANNDYTSWSSIYVTNISNNGFLEPTRLGDILYSVVSDNTFDELDIGSDDLSTGSLYRSRLIDNIMKSLTIHPGLNVETTIEGNEIGGTSTTFQCNMNQCDIKDNNLTGILFIEGTMMYNNLEANSVSSIVYTNQVTGDKLSKHINLSVTYNDIATALNINNNNNIVVKTLSKLLDSKILSNYQLTFIASDKVVRLIFNDNDGSCSFCHRAKKLQITSNNISLKFHKKIKDSIITSNILNKKLCFKKHPHNSYIEGNIVV